LESIAITTPASKLSYSIGEALDIAGLVVTGTYSDSTTKVETITTGNVTGFNSSAPAVGQVLTITVGGKTTTYTVTIVATPITAIAAISGTPQVGVELTAGALTPAAATATYQWQISATVDGTYTNITAATANKYTPVAGDVTKFIKVVATGTGSYSGSVTSAPTTAVVAATLESIAITTPASKLSYSIDDVLDITGLVVTGTYSDSTTKVETITTGNVTGFDSSAPAVGQVLTITVGGKTTTYTVTIVATPITAIAAITGTPKVGVELTAGALTPSAATASYQWQICATVDGTYTNISGAIVTTYTCVAGDATKFIKVVATGTGNYSGTVTSAATAAVAAAVINIAAIPGVTAPVKNATPVATITATDQYTGTVTWSPTHSPFWAATEYTATITLAPKAGFTLTGVTADFFTVAGVKTGVTTPTNPADSGVVTAIFPTTGAIAIGDNYQGGKIAYIDGTGIHGLIAATADQSAGIQWAVTNYQSTSVPEPGATGTAIGTGLANTNAIVAQNGVGSTYAAGLARAYNGGGLTDWFLPSKDELNQLYDNRVAIGVFVDSPSPSSYWSSSEATNNSAWRQFFSSDDQGGASKDNGWRVRAVRAF
jgi:hypothetical protein